MTIRQRNITVKELPGKLNRDSERRFFRELEPAMNVERPAIVLDCSQLREMDLTAIHLMLCCLEEAMKRNGDVRLAGVSAQAKQNLHTMNADRLFHMFETSQEAVESFKRRIAFATPFASMNSALASEHAA